MEERIVFAKVRAYVWMFYMLIAIGSLFSFVWLVALGVFGAGEYGPFAFLLVAAVFGGLISPTHSDKK